MCLLQVGGQPLWQGTEHGLVVLEEEGAGPLEDQSEDAMVMVRRQRAVQVEGMDCKDGTVLTLSPVPKLEDQKCCRRQSALRGLVEEEEEGEPAG